MNDFEFLKNRNLQTDRNFASQPYWAGVFKRFFAKKRPVIGLMIVSVILLLAVIGPMVSGYSYREISSVINPETGKQVVARGISPRIPWLHSLLGKEPYTDFFAEKTFLFGTDSFLNGSCSLCLRCLDKHIGLLLLRDLLLNLVAVIYLTYRYLANLNTVIFERRGL